MSKNKTNKKVVVGPRKIIPTQQKFQKNSNSRKDEGLLYTKTHYIYMGIGILLIGIGLLLMSGGSMPSDDVWDDNIIYSFRRTVLAPIVILLGLGVEVYAIFKK